jgi:hypothetical protein
MEAKANTRHTLYAAYDDNRRVTGFYHGAIHGTKVPKRAIKITPEQHTDAMRQQSEGMEMFVAASLDKLEYRKPVVTDEQKWATVRADRDRLLNELFWLVERHREQLDLGIETTLSEVQYKSLLKYRQALRDLPDSSKDSEAVVWPKPPAFIKRWLQRSAPE